MIQPWIPMKRASKQLKIPRWQSLSFNLQPWWWSFYLKYATTVLLNNTSQMCVGRLEWECYDPRKIICLNCESNFVQLRWKTNRLWQDRFPIQQKARPFCWTFSLMFFSKWRSFFLLLLGSTIQALVSGKVNCAAIYLYCNFFPDFRSTVSGVGAGIRRISEICFILGTFLLLMAFFLDDTFFLLNLVRRQDPNAVNFKFVEVKTKVIIWVD